MEIITAIALICQINIGYGSGDKSGYPEREGKRFVEIIDNEQESCQKKLATCILTGDKTEDSFRTSTALKCLKDR